MAEFILNITQRSKLQFEIVNLCNKQNLIRIWSDTGYLMLDGMGVSSNQNQASRISVYHQILDIFKNFCKKNEDLTDNTIKDVFIWTMKSQK